MFNIDLCAQIPMALDLGSMSSIRSFSSDLLSRFECIHLVVCNAGVMFPMEEHRRTSDGFEANVGINHLGHFLLVSLIKDRLLQSAPSRVVVVSSILLKEGEVHLSNLNCDLGIRAASDPNSATPVGYADSKLMNALFALELRRRMQLVGGGVDVYCVSPGWCRTKLHQNSASISCLKWPLLLLAAAVFMKSASKVCYTYCIIFCTYMYTK